LNTKIFIQKETSNFCQRLWLAFKIFSELKECTFSPYKKYHSGSGLRAQTQGIGRAEQSFHPSLTNFTSFQSGLSPLIREISHIPGKTSDKIGIYVLKYSLFSTKIQ
jgi:hypothetical protein